MNIITQDLVNEAKKILKVSFFKACQHYMVNSFNSFLEDLSPLSYVKSTLNLSSAIKKVIIETFKIAIPLIEEYFLNSSYRKMYFYKNKTIKRSITLLYGDLEFERNYYTDKNKKNGVFMIDELFHFEKYTTYDPVVRAILIDASISNNANTTSKNTSFILNNYEDYINKNSFKNISKQTIYDWLKKWELPKVENNYYEVNKRLYVMIDEKWIHEQIRLSLLDEEERKKHHYIMGKCFVTFTGAKTKHNRTKLLNRHVFMTSSDKPWIEFINEIYNIYNFEEFEEIYLLSDSGSWILAGKSELKLFKNNKVILNTCEFHVKEYINRMTKSKDKRKELIKAIYENKNKNSFSKIADEIIENAKNKEKKIQYKNYILNHWKAILNMAKREIKSSMEAHISHCMASYFGSRPKGFSRKRIEKYIKLQQHKINGINIMDLYLKSYNKKEDYIYNNEEVSYSLFDKTSSVIPTKSSNNPISIVLSKIAHGY